MAAGSSALAAGLALTALAVIGAPSANAETPGAWPGELSSVGYGRLLGTGTTLDSHRMVPADIVGVVRDLDYGREHAVAVNSNGRVFTWGRNDEGQLGRAGGRDDLLPGRSDALKDVVAVAAGARASYALDARGRVYSWGANDEGQLGHGDLATRDTPTVVAGLPRIVQLSVGEAHVLARTADGHVYAWGDNRHHQVDARPAGRVTAPVLLRRGGVTAVEAGFDRSFVVLRDGSVRSWGQNSRGALCQGGTHTRDSAYPKRVALNGKVAQVSSDAAHTLLLMESGRVWACGSNWYGQLGVRTTNAGRQVHWPTQVPKMTDVAQVETGPTTSVVRLRDGEVLGWGTQTDGSLGQKGDWVRYDVVSVTPYRAHDIAVGEFNTGIARRP